MIYFRGDFKRKVGKIKEDFILLFSVKLNFVISIHNCIVLYKYITINY